MEINLEQLISIYENSISKVEITDKDFNLVWKNKTCGENPFFAVGSVLFDFYEKDNIHSVIAEKGCINIPAFAFPHNEAVVNVIEIANFYIATFSATVKDFKMMESLEGIDVFSAFAREDTSSLFIHSNRLSSLIEDKKAEEDLDEIMRIGYKILKRSIDAVMFSRVTTGSLSLNRTTIDISSLLSSLCEATKIIVDVPIDMSFNVPKQSVPVFVDYELVEHAIIAVLLNSYKFTRDGNEISVSLETKGKNAVVTIKDKGAGIKPENLNNILRPYFSISPYSEQGDLRPGLGVGLSIASAVMRLHGGTILVSSEYGVGTKVVMTIPLLENQRQDDILKNNSSKYITNKFSTVFIGFSEICRIPH